jgi:ABC-type transport system involved in multi-copper enzyme maturation permease subunit
MTTSGDEPAGVETAESAVATRAAHLWKLIFVAAWLAVLWLIAVLVSGYGSWAAADGSFVQALATNTLAGLLLLVIAPILFSIVLRRSLRWSVGVAIVAATVLALAAFASGASRDLLLNLGTGLWFVLAIDFNIVHRFTTWTERLARETKEAVENIRHVL